MKFKKLVNTVLLSLLSGAGYSAVAGEYAAVDKSHCARLQNTTQPFILVLSKGDDLGQSINQCVASAKLPAVSVSGLGQLESPTLAYFTSNPEDKPALKTLDGFYELASLNGNVTNNRGEYYTHLHASLADKNFRGIAGHIASAKVGLTVEVTILPLLGSVERVVDSKTGFGPILTK